MKRLLIMFYILLVGIVTIGCEKEDINTVISNEYKNGTSEIILNEQNIIEDDNKPIDSDVKIIARYGEILEEYNGEFQVIIDVYINNELLNATMFRSNVNEDLINRYNGRDYVLAKPIMDFLNITYTISKEKDTIILVSEEYGTREYKYSTISKIIKEELYLDFNLFRQYTYGYFAQDDYVKIILYTGHYVHPNVPVNMEECYEILDNKLTTDEKEAIKNSNIEYRLFELSEIINWIHIYWLQSYKSEITDLLRENGVLHEEDQGFVIIEGYYRYLNGEYCSIEDWRSWYLAE